MFPIDSRINKCAIQLFCNKAIDNNSSVLEFVLNYFKKPKDAQ